MGNTCTTEAARAVVDNTREIRPSLSHTAGIQEHADEDSQGELQVEDLKVSVGPPLPGTTISVRDYGSQRQQTKRRERDSRPDSAERELEPEMDDELEDVGEELVHQEMLAQIEYQIAGRQYELMFGDRVFLGLDRTYGRLVSCCRFSVRNVTTEEERSFNEYKKIALSLCHPNIVQYLKIELKRDLEGEQEEIKKMTQRRNDAYSNPASMRIKNFGDAISMPKATVMIVTDRLPSLTLQSIIGQGKSIPENTVRRIIKQVLSALAYLHSKNLYHGNVKASRITLGSEGSANLGRVELFGIAEIERNLLAGKNDLVSSMKGCIWDECTVLDGNGNEIRAGDVQENTILASCDKGETNMVLTVVHGRCELIKLTFDVENNNSNNNNNNNNNEAFEDLLVTPNHIIAVYDNEKNNNDNNIEHETVFNDILNRRNNKFMWNSIKFAPAAKYMNRDFMSVILIKDEDEEIIITSEEISNVHIQCISTYNEIPVILDVPKVDLNNKKVLFSYCIKLSELYNCVCVKTMELGDKLRHIFRLCGSSPKIEKQSKNNYLVYIPTWYKSLKHGDAYVIPNYRLIKTHIPLELTEQLPYTGWQIKSTCFKTASGILTHNSPFWMAPEVARQKVEFYDKTDIWSLGSLTLELLTGMPAFRNLNDTAAVMYYLTKEANIQPEIPRNISNECQDFLVSCFTTNPQQRPSAVELLKSDWFTIPIINNGDNLEDSTDSYMSDSFSDTYDSTTDA